MGQTLLIASRKLVDSRPVARVLRAMDRYMRPYELRWKNDLDLRCCV